MPKTKTKPRDTEHDHPPNCFGPGQLSFVGIPNCLLKLEGLSIAAKVIYVLLKEEENPTWELLAKLTSESIPRLKRYVRELVTHDLLVESDGRFAFLDHPIFALVYSDDPSFDWCWDEESQ